MTSLDSVPGGKNCDGKEIENRFFFITRQSEIPNKLRSADTNLNGAILCRHVGIISFIITTFPCRSILLLSHVFDQECQTRGPPSLSMQPARRF